eukprot:gene7037-14313_t
MTTVAEEGNRRRGEASDEEIRQCSLDPGLRRRVRTLKELLVLTVQGLEKATELSMPEGLAILLSVIDGHIWFMDKKMLSIEGILSTLSEVDSSKKWHHNFIPFCGDPSGMLVIDTSSGEILEWDEDDGAGETVSSTFSSFLESYRNDLLAGHMEFLEDCGVIEAMSKPKK